MYVHVDLKLDGYTDYTCTLMMAVVRERLEARGVLGQLRAQIRAEVYKALDDQVVNRDMHEYLVVQPHAFCKPTPSTSLIQVLLNFIL